MSGKKSYKLWTHDTLVGRPGKYQALWEAQAQYCQKKDAQYQEE